MTDYYEDAATHYRNAKSAGSRGDFPQASARATLGLLAIELAKAQPAPAAVDPDPEEVLNIFLVVNEQDGQTVQATPGEHLTIVPLDRVYGATRGRKVRYIGSTGSAYHHHKWEEAREVVLRAELRTNPTD